MTRITMTTQALLAGALIVTPAVALAQNSVSKQANVVADKAEDLQAATNTLNAKVDAEQRNQAALAADGNYADPDNDGDPGRHHDDDGDDDHGNWGLLGLLGLAGLLGLRGRNDHIKRDHRRDPRGGDATTRTSGTRTGTDTTRL